MHPGSTSRPAVSILVDYTCRTCGHLQESWVASPAPTEIVCAGCGGTSARRWSPVGLIGDRSAVASRSRRAGKSLCADNPDVPGLCHMSETAGRAWIARYRGDERALDAEYSRQEKAHQEIGAAPTMADAISHGHNHAGMDV